METHSFLQLNYEFVLEQEAIDGFMLRRRLIRTTRDMGQDWTKVMIQDGPTQLSVRIEPRRGLWFIVTLFSKLDAHAAILTVESNRIS